MRYRILGNKAVIADRTSEISAGELCVHFDGVPTGMTAIFNCHGVQMYRTPINECCKIEIKREDDITLKLVDMETKFEITCEGLRVRKSGDEYIVFPDDGDLPQLVADLSIEMSELRQENKSLNEKVEKLETKLTEYMEGWDIT